MATSLGSEKGTVWLWPWASVQLSTLCMLMVLLMEATARLEG